MTGVLNDGFAADLRALSLDELRAKRDKARQTETDLSYMRRMVQGQLDIVHAELAHRGKRGPAPEVANLAGILADESRGAPRGMGVYLSTEPSLADDQRRYVEDLSTGVDLTNIGACTNAALRDVLAKLRAAEVELSDTRAAVHNVLDACGAELTRRYRDGEAVVDDLLTQR